MVGATSAAATGDTWAGMGVVLGGPADQVWAAEVADLAAVVDLLSAVEAVVVDRVDLLWAVAAVVADRVDLLSAVEAVVVDRVDLLWAVAAVAADRVDLLSAVEAVVADQVEGLAGREAAEPRALVEGGRRGRWRGRWWRSRWWRSRRWRTKWWWRSRWWWRRRPWRLSPHKDAAVRRTAELRPGMFPFPTAPSRSSCRKAASLPARTIRLPKVRGRLPESIDDREGSSLRTDSLPPYL